MPNFGNAKSSNFTPAPAGTHIARCFGCISLGTQHSEMFADAFKIMLMFELPHEQVEVDKERRPMTVQKEYTFSKSKKSNLRKALESWRGRPFTDSELLDFEISDVVGAPCQLTIIHATSGTGSTYAKIEAITGLSKGTTCPPQFHGSVKYEIEHGKNDVFQKLPEWIQKKILDSEEMNPTAPGPKVEDAGAEPPHEVDESSVPF